MNNVGWQLGFDIHDLTICLNRSKLGKKIVFKCTFIPVCGGEVEGGLLSQQRAFCSDNTSASLSLACVCLSMQHGRAKTSALVIESSFKYLMLSHVQTCTCSHMSSMWSVSGDSGDDVEICICHYGYCCYC